MLLKSAIAACVAVVFLSSCVSPPKTDICSVDYDVDTKSPYMSCTPTDNSRPEYEVKGLDILGYQCLSPDHYAELKAYLKHLMRELDALRTN